MQTLKPSLLVMMLLAACDGNPFVEEPDGGTDGGGGGVTSDFPLTGTTTNPTRGKAIQRVENQDSVSGNGFAQDFEYDADNDTFLVDNLAFDGENVYTRDIGFNASPPDAPGTLPGSDVSIFKGDQIVRDSDGEIVDQFAYRALYGTSTSGQTEFAIVRTGSYIPYGFGGFVYQRNGGVTLPSSGQAHFEGDYSAIRDFNGPDTIVGGIEYVTGQMVVDIDFDDFNDAGATRGDGVKGYVYDREVFDINGNNVTGEIIAALNGDTGTANELPVLVFEVGPYAMTNAGEVTAGINSVSDGELYEDGTYYAVISGDDAGEIVGIIVVESQDPREGMEAVTVRETGGFIVYN